MARTQIDQRSLTEAIAGIDAEESIIAAARLQTLIDNNPKFLNRLNGANTQEKRLKVVRLLYALSRTWTSEGDEFRFEEVEEFSKDSNGEPFVWSGHGKSKPHKLFKVFRCSHTKGDPDFEKWVELPLNVGFTTKPMGRVGVVGQFVEMFEPKRGGVPYLTAISAYVQEHNASILTGVRTVNGKEVRVARGLAAQDIRGKIETALMDMLHSVESDAVFSSILFNLRDNPPKGLFLGITGLYGKRNCVVLPMNGNYLPGKRAAQREAGKDSGDDGSNNSLFIGYLNKESMDLSKFPKLDLAPFKGAEIQEVIKFIDRANKAHKTLLELGKIREERKLVTESKKIDELLGLEAQLLHKLEVLLPKGELGLSLERRVANMLTTADKRIGTWGRMADNFLRASYGMGTHYNPSPGWALVTAIRDGLTEFLPEAVLSPSELTKKRTLKGGAVTTAMHELAKTPDRIRSISADAVCAADTCLNRLEELRLTNPNAFVCGFFAGSAKLDVNATLLNLKQQGLLAADIRTSFGTGKDISKLTFSQKTGFGYRNSAGELLELTDEPSHLAASTDLKRLESLRLTNPNAFVCGFFDAKLDVNATLLNLNQLGLLTSDIRTAFGIGKDTYRLTFSQKSGFGYRNSSGKLLAVTGEPSQVSSLPSSAFTRETLMVVDSKGVAPIHLMAESGQLKYVPHDLLTRRMLTFEDCIGRTPVHIAAESGFLPHLPAHVITKELLTRKNGPAPAKFPHGNFSDRIKDAAWCDTFKVREFGKCSPVEVAAFCGSLDQIPAAILKDILVTNSQARKRLIISAALGAKDALGCLINLSPSSQRHLLLDTSVGGWSVLHSAARTGNISQIPKDLLTESHLLNCDSNMNTVVHVAAAAGFLNQIPENLLTENVMLTTDEIKDTPLHNAARGGFLRHVPQVLLTEEHLLKKNAFGATVFNLAAPNFDPFLGIELSEAVREFVGDAWYNKNLEICKAKPMDLRM